MNNVIAFDVVSVMLNGRDVQKRPGMSDGKNATSATVITLDWKGRLKKIQNGCEDGPDIA